MVIILPSPEFYGEPNRSIVFNVRSINLSSKTSTRLTDWGSYDVIVSEDRSNHASYNRWLDWRDEEPDRGWTAFAGRCAPEYQTHSSAPDTWGNGSLAHYKWHPPSLASWTCPAPAPVLLSDTPPSIETAPASSRSNGLNPSCHSTVQTKLYH